MDGGIHAVQTHHVSRPCSTIGDNGEGGYTLTGEGIMDHAIDVVQTHHATPRRHRTKLDGDRVKVCPHVCHIRNHFIYIQCGEIVAG